MSTTVLEALRSEGFSPSLFWPEPEDPNQPTTPVPRLVVDGTEPLPNSLREAVRENRDALKASILLSDPPAWLARLFDLYWSDTDTPR